MSMVHRKKSQLQTGSGQSLSGLYSSLQDEINDVFENFFNSKTAIGKNEMNEAFVPAIDIVENEKSYVVSVELPGLKEDEIELQVDSGHLVLKGEREQKHQEKSETVLVNETSYGSFYRSFPLPDNVDADEQYSANLENGILSIVLPKKKDSKSKIKSIPIKAK